MIEFRCLKLNELDSWFDHCAKVFTTSKQYFVNHWSNDPWKDINNIFVAVENNKILSTVRVFNREVYLCGKKISMGGIGEVSTISEARGLGLSSKLLNMAIEHMKAQNIHISILFGNHPNYSKLGWRFNPLSFKISEAHFCKQAYNIRNIDFNKDINNLQTIYKNYSSQFNGAVARESDFYWLNWIKAEAKNCFIAECSDGTIAGYMCANNKKDMVNVNDFAQDLCCKNVFEELSSYVCTEFKSDYIKYPSIIENTLSVKYYDKNNYIMLRLISPLEINNLPINTTEDLINIMNDSNYNNKFLFWSIDGF